MAVRPAFVIHSWNKAPYIAKSIIGALSQTVACDIYISDQGSTDGTLDVIKETVESAPRGTDIHRVEILKCPLPAGPHIRFMNDHVDWFLKELFSRDYYEWIFTSSADDYSLPNRVKVCLEAVADKPCSVVATNQFYEEPETGQRQMSGQPEGYVHAGNGLRTLAYGSVIAAYSSDFLSRVGSAGRHTPDVYWGFLAALDRGFYICGSHEHVHVNVKASDNAGFGGKMQAAQGDELARLNELNHYQLLGLYLACNEKATQLHGKLPDEHMLPLVEMICSQAAAWYGRRTELHEHGIQPGMMPV